MRLSMEKKKEIIIARHLLSPASSSFETKLVLALKKRGYTINSISFTPIKKENRHLFSKKYSILQKEGHTSKIKILFNMFKLIFHIRKIKNSIIIGISQPNWFISLIFYFLHRKSNILIYFPYDIAYFRFKNYKKYPKRERFSEKYNFKKCDGIIHKGPEDELKYLPEEFKALEKPSLQFLPYCDSNILKDLDEEYFKNKLSEKDGETHVAYVGRILHNVPNRYPTLNIFKAFIEQDICVHAYALNYKQIKNDSDYKKLMKNNYFKLHKTIYGNQLQHELRKYDYGLNIVIHNFKHIKKIWAQTAFGNKMSTYLEAGIPNIINDELTFCAEVAEKNGFGIIVKNLNEMKFIKDKKDYKTFCKNLEKNRQKFTIEANINKLIEFINKLQKKTSHNS
jgi:hypothetical protein